MIMFTLVYMDRGQRIKLPQLILFYNMGSRTPAPPVFRLGSKCQGNDATTHSELDFPTSLNSENPAQICL